MISLKIFLKQTKGLWFSMSEAEKAYSELLIGVIMIGVGYAVYTILGPALVFPGVTQVQTYIANNASTWTAQEQSMGTSSNVFTLLGWMLVPIGLAIRIF